MNAQTDLTREILTAFAVAHPGDVDVARVFRRLQEKGYSPYEIQRVANRIGREERCRIEGLHREFQGMARLAAADCA